MTWVKVADYPSITAASKKTGYSLGAIAQCIAGNLFQAYGYRWESPAKPSRPVTVPPRPVFNTYLWKKLGCPKTSRKRPIAAVNLSDQNMPGERWRPIEETGGAYCVSSYGRIKALPRLKQGKFHVWTKEMIKRLTPDTKAHRPASCLLCQLSRDGKKYQQSVARLVYHYFVRPIKLKDTAIRISYKNGKCYDLHYRNLSV